MNLTFALVGNQNSGKSTLFNKLTGSSQHVSNFPGTTIGKTEGKLIGQEAIKIIDLPGIYSLSPNTPEEIVMVNLDPSALVLDMLIGLANQPAT